MASSGPSRLSRRRLIGLSAAALSLAGCRVLDSPLNGVFKIGLVAPFSGRDYTVGYNILFGVKLALKDYNDRGGTNGWRVEMIAQDDSNDEKSGLVQARKFALDEDVLCVIGHPSSASALAAAPVYQQANLPLLTLASSALLTTEGGGIFRIGPSDPAIAGLSVGFLPTKITSNRLALVAGDSNGGKLAELVSKSWSATSGVIVFGDGIPSESVDFGPIAERVLATRPDAVFFAGGFELGAPLYAEVRRIAPGVVFLGSPACASPHFLKMTGSPTDFAYVVTSAVDPVEVPQAANFVQRFRATWGVDPLPQALLAFDAAQLILSTVADLGKGEKPKRPWMEASIQNNDYNGLSGPMKFDGRGETIRSNPAVYRMVGGRFPGERQSV